MVTDAGLDSGMRFTGRIGIPATATVAVVLAIHPFATTALHDDGTRFLEHVSAHWVTLHVVAALALLWFPTVFDGWARRLRPLEAVFMTGATLLLVLMLLLSVALRHVAPERVQPRAAATAG